MKQYDFYKNTDKETQTGYPYFIDIQAELLNDLKSRVVIPLVPAKDATSYPANLCSIIKISGKNFALLTHQITAIPTSLLENKEGSLIFNRNEIIAALDFLLTGI